MENSVWQTVLAILTSFGGAGFIIFAASKWLAKLTAEKILKKADFEYSQKIEDLKSSLERKNYISKVRFDLEIEVYRQLSEVVFSMVLSNSALFPFSGEPPKDKEKRRKFDEINHSEAVEKYNIANTVIAKNAPFIPEDIFKDFDEIREECRKQIRLFLYRHDPDDLLCGERSKCYPRTVEIGNKWDELLKKLRTHIASLDVLDK